MTKITFNNANTKKLAEQLATCITETGFNTLSKNDFYDYVLYLLNKYSDKKFLILNSNEENAYLLKVKPEKVKSSKFNIFLKFEEKDEQEKALRRLVNSIIDNPELITRYDNDKSELRLTIEDPVIRFCLDGKMKALLNVSLDTSFNNEIATMRKADFFKVLSSIVQDDDDLKKEITALEKKVKKENIEEGVKTIFGLLINGAVEVIDKTIPLPVETIKNALRLIRKK
jgi:hypothetical protein